MPVVLLALIGVFQTLNDQFLTPGNISTIVESASLPAVVACGLTIVLTLNQFDLSIQAVAGFGTTMFAVLMGPMRLTFVSAVIVMLVAGTAIGTLTGTLVAYQRLSALVVTVGLASILNGLEFYFSDSQSVSTGIEPGFIEFVRARPMGIPTLVIAALLVAAAIWILLERTALGREMRAIGSNPEAARFAGVNVKRTILFGFIITAITCTIAGMFYTGRQGIAYPLNGMTVLLPAFSACFIGAAMFKVGEFNIPGTLVGSVLASVVANGLLLANVGGYATYLFQGGILVFAVLLARVVGAKEQAA